jgi:2-keto-4-pentenoate hydratase/2-oxohepta-3-ene-1,7-dioic acid hydratase in catechol pathway
VRIARFSVGDRVAFGVVEESSGQGADGGEGLFVAPISGHPFGPIEPSDVRVSLADVRLLAPVLPSKVIGVGRNYADHARELANDVPPEPLLFFKPSTAVIGPGDGIAYPGQSQNVQHEAELAVVIGRLCREVPRERVADVVLGYTCGNDVTARDLQESDNQWARAKGFDTFCPLGPWIETELDPGDVAITCTVGSELRQAGRTKQMVHDVAALVSYISDAFTLLPGDVILTGTPAGVSPLAVGDEVSVNVEGIGTLTNRVVTRD